MVVHLLGATIRAAVTVAVAIPGLDWLTELIGQSVGLEVDAADALIGLDQLEEGAGKTTASIVTGIHNANEYLADAAAGVTKAVNPNITDADYRENFGIIPKAVTGAFDAIPGTVEGAFAPESRGALVTGAATGVVATSLLPGIGSEVGYVVKSTANGALQMGNRAANMAQTTASNMGNHVQKLTGQRASAPSINAAPVPA